MSQDGDVDSAEAILISRLALALQSTDSACSHVVLTVNTIRDAGWAYKVGRCAAFRGRGGLPRASIGNSTNNIPAPSLKVVVVNPPSWVFSWPPVVLAVAEGDLSLATADELASEDGPTLMVCRKCLVMSSFKADYTVVLDACDDKDASSGGLHRIDPVTGTAIMINAKDTFIPEVRSAFTQVLSTALGPGDMPALRLLAPLASQGFASKLVMTARSDGSSQETSGAEITASARPSDIRVWTEPAPSGSVSIALSLLRLSPGMLEKLLPLLQMKVAYLRNSGGDLSAECTEAVEAAAEQHIPLEGSPHVLAAVVRLLLCIGSPQAAQRVSLLGLGLCGHGCVPALILRGRCLEATDEPSVALECFANVLAIEETHAEASKAVARLQAAIAAFASTTLAAPSTEPDSEPSSSNGKSKAWGRLMERARAKSLVAQGYEEIEAAARLSSSKMYDLMRHFYEQRGLDAWGDGSEASQQTVPFYITSNPHISGGYAASACALVRDWHHAGALDLTQPVFIIELGTGPGKFSGLFLDALSLELDVLRAEHRDLSNLDVCVVMTDFCESNIGTWHSDPSLAPHFTSGLLDVGLLDCDAPSISLTVRTRGVTIDASSPTTNPILALANYVFDSIKMDAFRVNGDVLQEARVSTYVMARNSVDTNEGVDPSIPGTIQHEWSYHPISDPVAYYPGEERLGLILEWYRQHLPEKSTFTFPVSGLRLIHRLESWTSSGSVALLIADKAHTRVRQLASRRGSPIVSLHGSLSMLVNLDAVGRYCAGQSVSSYVTLYTPHQNASIDVCFLHLGVPSVPRAVQIFLDQVALFSPYDVFTIRDHAEDVAASNGGATINLVLTILRLARWDPDVLSQFADTVQGATASAAIWDVPTKRAAAALLDTIPILKHSPRFDRDNQLRDKCNELQASLGDALAS